MKKIFFIFCLSLHGLCFCQPAINESYKIVSLDGMIDIRQALAGKPIESNHMINLTCMDSKNKLQKLSLLFSIGDSREIVKINSNSATVYINLPLNEYEDYYTKMEQIFIKKVLRGGINVNVISGTNSVSLYYYLLNN